MQVSTKKTYVKPEIIFEMELETRAGSVIELLPVEEPNLDLNIEP